MKIEAAIAQIASLATDPSRSTMLGALMDGRAYTATELARAAGVAPSTASNHLAQLTGAGLVTPIKQGRHRYFKLSNEEVAEAIEGLGAAAIPIKSPRTLVASERKLAEARVCYDHIAGVLGVRIYRALLNRGTITLSSEGIALTREGEQFFAEEFGIVDWNILGRKPACRLCLDWTERTYHLGGAASKMLMEYMLSRHWIRRADTGRLLTITPKGAPEIARLFPVAR